MCLTDGETEARACAQGSELRAEQQSHRGELRDPAGGGAGRPQILSEHSYTINVTKHNRPSAQHGVRVSTTPPVQQECCRPSGREPPSWGDTRAPCSAQCPLPRQTEACADQVSNIKPALQAPFFMLWRAPWLSGRIVCSFVSERLPCERMPGRWH